MARILDLDNTEISQEEQAKIIAQQDELKNLMAKQIEQDYKIAIDKINKINEEEQANKRGIDKLNSRNKDIHKERTTIQAKLKSLEEAMKIYGDAKKILPATKIKKVDKPKETWVGDDMDDYYEIFEEDNEYPNVPIDVTDKERKKLKYKKELIYDSKRMV